MNAPAQSSAALTVALILSSCPVFGDDPGAVLGRVGGTEIKMEDIRAALANLAPGEKESISKDPAQLNLMVRALLVQRLVLKEALEKKWDQKPDVALHLERIRDSAITESYLQSIARPPEGYPGEEDLKAAYEAGKASLLVPRTWCISQIFIAGVKTPNPAARNKLEMVRQSLKRPGADFATIARTHSEDAASAKNGGQIGWLAEAQIQPEIRQQLPKLAVNVISDPIRLDDGWHIIKVTDIREAHTPTLEQIRGQLVRQMRSDRTRANTQAHLARLLKDNPVAVNELALSRVLTDAAK